MNAVLGKGEGKRLFLAVPPPPALVRTLDALGDRLESDRWKLRRSEPEDLHLTLHFLGATPSRVIDDLKREIGAVCHARRPFDLAVEGIGCFPDDLEPRVLWAGVRDPAGRLEELFEASRRVLNAYRLFQLREEFTPHLTLARVERLSSDWDPRPLRALAAEEGRLGNFPVEEVRLMESRVSGGSGPRYETLARLGMGGQARVFGAGTPSPDRS